jgi:hypothetical protein
MDAAELAELNDKITARGETLGRLVLKRVSHVIREYLTDARTVRLLKLVNNTYVLERVAGPSSKVLYRFANDKAAVDPVTVFNDDTEGIIEDLVTYARVGGARLHAVEASKSAGSATVYSIHLRTDV